MLVLTRELSSALRFTDWNTKMKITHFKRFLFGNDVSNYMLTVNKFSRSKLHELLVRINMNYKH